MAQHAIQHLLVNMVHSLVVDIAHMSPHYFILSTANNALFHESIGGESSLKKFPTKL
jgi:hypothetical protein